MVTRETKFRFGCYQIRFYVCDDKEWFVTIDDVENEFGASSYECNNNWNKGVAEAFLNFASAFGDEEAENLMYEMILCENIDNHFQEYLPFKYAIACFGCPFNKDCELSPGVCIGDI